MVRRRMEQVTSNESHPAIAKSSAKKQRRRI
jgi:hypothetical protein